MDAHAKLAARASLRDMLSKDCPSFNKEDRTCVALFYVEMAILAFARITGRRKDKLCAEVPKMAALMSAKGHALGVASLMVGSCLCVCVYIRIHGFAFVRKIKMRVKCRRWLRLRLL
jgi:hypothetical protein